MLVKEDKVDEALDLGDRHKVSPRQRVAIGLKNQRVLSVVSLNWLNTYWETFSVEEP